MTQDKLTEPALLARYQCVLTTYGTLATEAPAKERQAVKIKKQVLCGQGAVCGSRHECGIAWSRVCEESV